MKTNATQYGALVLRVALGVMFVAHGLLKVMVFTMPGTVQFFQSVGLPGFLAYVTVLVELGVGALLIVGYQSRIAALVSLPILLGAAWVHVPNGWVFSAPNGGWEYPVFLAVAVIAQALLGDGAYAIGNVKEPSPARLARA
ncbi:MAG: DoxX family protein [Pseudomonadota bacterium]|nr:MAG: DoxX family protein [Pseudomonadota bacterium]